MTSTSRGRKLWADRHPDSTPSKAATQAEPVEPQPEPDTQPSTVDHGIVTDRGGIDPSTLAPPERTTGNVAAGRKRYATRHANRPGWTDDAA